MIFCIQRDKFTIDKPTVYRSIVMKTTQETTNPIFSNQDLIRLIWPLFLEQLLSVSMGMADTLMVSSVGEAAVSSVSLVDNLNILFMQIVSALAAGGAVISSQYLGRQNIRKAKKSSSQLYSILSISTLSVMLIILIFSRPLLYLVFGNIENDVMAFAQTYFLISAVSYPFMGFYNAGAALFRAQGNSQISMRASLVMNIINICGNALLIYGFRMGVLGAALATLIGRIFAAVYITMQHQRKDNPFRIDSFAELRPDRKMIKGILSIGIPSGLENGMFQFGKVCVSSLTSTLGTSAIAANAIANTVSGVANIPGNTINLSIIPIVGRCLGAGDKKQATRYTKLLVGLSMTGIAVSNILIFLLIPWIARLFHLSPEASSMCVTVVHWFNLFSILFWTTSFSLPHALRSGGDSRFTMLISIFSMWIFRVILSYFFVGQLHMGLTGVWFGMFIDWIFRSMCFIARFFSGKWMEHKVI